MAFAKIVQFLRGAKPGVLAITGPVGCGKRHAISEAAQQARVALTHHDLAQGTIEWSMLGTQQLTPAGLKTNVHMVSNASAEFLKDLAFVKSVQAKIILVADDTCARLRASGVPLVRMQRLGSDAMAKKLFLDLDWPAEEAVRVAALAKGDWHQALAQRQLACHAGADVGQSSALDACSSKDDTLANEPPCMIANRFLNGTAPGECGLDPSTMAWVERNHAARCDDLEALARRQEMLAVSADGLCLGCPASEALFKCAASFASKRVHYQSGLYKNPWEKDEATMRDISTSFKKQRTSFNDGLKERALREEAANMNAIYEEGRDSAAIPTAKAKGKPKSKAVAKTPRAQARKKK